MTNSLTQRVCTALVGMAIISSCSRPVAYFQRGPVAPSSAATRVAIPEPVQPLAEVHPPAQTPVDQPEAYARTDSKLSTQKNLGVRMSRIKTLLAATAEPLAPKLTHASGHMNGVQKLLLKKVNRQLSRRLAPHHPEKALMHTGKLIGSLVLLVGGLVLLFAGTGTVAFIGIILSLVGAVGIIVSLFGIDS